MPHPHTGDTRETKDLNHPEMTTEGQMRKKGLTYHREHQATVASDASARPTGLINTHTTEIHVTHVGKLGTRPKHVAAGMEPGQTPYN